ncbi:hypothetical protein HK097_005922 [Rhizophlyctis rosea]|uniref:Uncharacterized protein n=1 Tax=Rhizophlyctis rosea TaxID=64517 RepID=A0AAD5X6N4_9FUNG|nr:hypothetical protein HK097_005922 [Rhizophlyctis rosea]
MFEWRANQLDETLSNEVDAAMASFQTSGHGDYHGRVPEQATCIEGLTTEALEKHLASMMPEVMEPLQFDAGSVQLTNFSDGVLPDFPDCKLAVAPTYGGEGPHIGIADTYEACSSLASSSSDAGAYEQATYGNITSEGALPVHRLIENAGATDYMQLQSHFTFDEHKLKCSQAGQPPAHADIFESGNSMDLNRLRKVAKLNRNKADHQVFDIRRGGEEVDVNGNSTIGGMAGFADMSSPYGPSSPL